MKPTKILADAKASSVLSIEEEQTLKLNVKHFYKKKRIRQKGKKNYFHKEGICKKFNL